ncbi:MerR family transcriptional regulator [Vibrio viridaestus]|uniref:MerR family transcriptional regulator n=1 Tax=Vibrio viridaestus TaxID=2487322 RepID=A0A3N9TJD2_9VIBR|nr:MerR family transcriptional regulator [Vibrio viridaestus]RQW64271.1 MerR family transcriptional regulator [Vibrio viridaestus]
MKIGELSKRTGVSQRMLRYYEEFGLFRTERAANGYRIYDSSLINLVTHIKSLSSAGMKLDTIKVLLPCLRGEGSELKFVGCNEVKANLKAELDAVNLQLEELSESRNKVAKYLGELLPIEFN